VGLLQPRPSLKQVEQSSKQWKVPRAQQEVFINLERSAFYIDGSVVRDDSEGKFNRFGHPEKPAHI
jgi:hypothetical protein